MAYHEGFSGFGHEASSREVSQGIGRVARRVMLLIDVWRQRRALAQLTDGELRDVGLTRADVRAELEAPVLEVPRAQVSRLAECNRSLPR